VPREAVHLWTPLNYVSGTGTLLTTQQSLDAKSRFLRWSVRLTTEEARGGSREDRGSRAALLHGLAPSRRHVDARRSYLNAHNADPTPYVWTATAGSILAKVQRARTKLQQVVNEN
jgi:hypothetical protein